jgi:predicted nucleic acid-binding protein
LTIIGLCESGDLELMSSEALLFELSRNPNPMRRRYASEVLSCSCVVVSVSDAVMKRAERLNAIGIKPLDALHTASAEEADAAYFCTCDDGILKKAGSLSDFNVKVVSPTELIPEIEP